MSCTNCKQKGKTKNDIMKKTNTASTYVTWFVVLWSLFAIYGIYSLFVKLL